MEEEMPRAVVVDVSVGEDLVGALVVLDLVVAADGGASLTEIEQQLTQDSL